MLANIMGGFIVILIGVNLMPIVAQQVGIAQADGNVTGSTSTILGLTPLFFSLSIMSVAVSISVAALRNAGLV